MACDNCPIVQRALGWNFLSASLVGMRAASVKDASTGKVDRGRYIAGELGVASSLSSQSGDRRHQRLSVGVSGAGEQLFGSCQLANTAKVHNCDSA